jgi:hypothetical protein
MSVRRLADQQPASFAFTPENEERCEEILKKYPEGREASAVISLLWRTAEPVLCPPPNMGLSSGFQAAGLIIYSIHPQMSEPLSRLNAATPPV